MKVVFSDQAKTDLREIAFFIARTDKARALSFVSELRARAQQIGDMPMSFPLLPRYAQHGIRRRTVRGYLIFYRVADDRVYIVHILHGARDYASLVSPEA